MAIETILRNAELEAPQVVVKLMGTLDVKERRRIIREKLDILCFGLEPFLSHLLSQTQTEQIRAQALLNGLTFSSEVARELAIAGRYEEGARLARLSLEWTCQVLPLLAKLHETKRCQFIVDLVLIHGDEFRKRGLDEPAMQGFLLIDPVFEALELVESNLEPDRLKGDTLQRVLEAEATLEHVGFAAEHLRLRKAIDTLTLAPRNLKRRREKAREKIQDHWRQLPSPPESDGLTPATALPFRSVKVARQWVTGLQCPRCNGELALAGQSIDTAGDAEERLLFRLRCESCHQDPVIIYNSLPSASRLKVSPQDRKRGETLEQAVAVREYIDLLKSFSQFPPAEKDAIELECATALATLLEVLPRVLPGRAAPKPHVEVGVIPGLGGLQISPFAQQCRDGFAIIVPEMFAIRLSRFARHLALTWGAFDEKSGTTKPAIEGDRAKELARMLHREFWGVGMDTMPTEVPEPMRPLWIAILENCLTFVIAHELAHIFLEHAGRRQFIDLAKGSQGLEELSLLSYGQPDEIVADQVASRLVCQAAREKAENEILAILAMASVDVFFTLLTLIEQKFPPDPREHPPAQVRRAALRSQVGTGISCESLQFGISAQISLEAHAEEPLHVPDLPETLRGNWQNIESALRMLSVGEKEKSLAHLTRFLIRAPSDEEGWKLLRHLLLAERPGTAIVSPRAAILAVPEITEGVVVVKLAKSLADPAGSRQLERKIWMKYAEELLHKAAAAGGLEQLSLDDEEEALSHFLLLCAYVPGLDLCRGGLACLLAIEEKGLLREFVYFARFISMERPGFAQFRDRLSEDSFKVHELFRALVVPAPT